MTRRSLPVLDLQPGSTLANGKYQICALVGAGAMGQVYRAVHTALGRTVAIKVFLPEMSSDEYGEARFLREARAASKLQHPASMQVLDFGSENGVFYIVMEYLDGQNLARLIDEEAPLEPERIARLMLQVLAALAAAHEHGVIHRDLKPENIILLRQINDDGIPVESLKVCDFGIAKIQATAGQETHGTLTKEGTVMGTPSYMSPEQCRGLDIDLRSDIYSCGVMLFEMATGRVPFEAENPIGLMMQHITDLPPDPRAINGNVHPLLAQIVLKCLSKDREGRYSSARDLREDLKQLVPGGSGSHGTLYSIAPLRPAAASGSLPAGSGSQGMPPAESSYGQGGQSPSQSIRSSPVLGPSSQRSLPPEEENDMTQRTSSEWDVSSDDLVGAGKRRRVALIVGSVSLLVVIGGLVWGIAGEVARGAPSNAIATVPLQIGGAEQGSLARAQQDHEADVQPAGDNRGEGIPSPVVGDTVELETGSGESVSEAQQSPDTPDDEMDNSASTGPSQRWGHKRAQPRRSTEKAEGTSSREAEDDEEPAGDESAIEPVPGQGEGEGATEEPTPEKREEPIPDKSVTSKTLITAPTPKPAPTVPPREKAALRPVVPALDARVGLSDLIVRGSLPATPVKTGIERLNDEWQACYQRAARAAGRDVQDTLQVKLVIDEDGRARGPSVSPSSLPNLSRCVLKAAMKIRSATRPDTGTVQVAFKLQFIPKPPTR